ncbi:hypothetical protein GCM10028798_22230 [Humibacter antri]
MLWPIFITALLFLTLTLTVGATSLWPAQWDRKLYAAGEAEISRRFADYRALPQVDHIAARRLLGHKPRPVWGDYDRETTILAAVSVMTNAEDRARLSAELQARRVQLEVTALRRQVRLVARISNFAIASYLWSALRTANALEFSLCGLIWFLPHTVPFLVRVHGKHLAGATIGGALLGVLVAGFTVAGSPNGSSTDWAGIAGGTAMISLLAALVTATFGLFKAFLTTRFGAVRQWTRKGITSSVVLVVFVGSFLYLDLSGVFGQRTEALTVGTQHLHFSTQESHWIGGILLLAFTGYNIHNAWAWVRNRTVKLSNRIQSATALLFLLLLAVLIVSFLLNLPVTSARWILLGGMLTVLSVAFGGLVMAAVEWVQKYRAIARAGWTVKRRGFRWWALISWCSALVAQATSELIGPLRPSAANPVLYDVVGAVFSLITLACVIAFCPGVIITVLYVQRVSAVYRDLQHLQSPDHPALASDEWCETRSSGRPPSDG